MNVLKGLIERFSHLSLGSLHVAVRVVRGSGLRLRALAGVGGGVGRFPGCGVYSFSMFVISALLKYLSSPAYQSTFLPM